MHSKCYDFSGIKITVESEIELPESEALRKFASECETPDYIVTLEFREQLTDVLSTGTRRHSVKTKLDADLPEQTVICTEYCGDGCRMYALERFKESFDVDSVFRHLPLYYVLLKHDAIVIHASYVLINGEAILFSAPSGTGKSTQAELWRAHRGARIINGDRVLIRRGENGFTAGGIYYSGTSGICENVTAPIRAIVLLSQAGESITEKCRGGEALRRLLRECAYSAQLENNAADAASLLADLVNGVDIVKLACLPDESAVIALENYLTERN
ncbi:MAG: hypothetical protein Q4A83_00015 [Bacillota bacterium]|nr:hypothetical protein [Bacillota bacterium]